jgi:hypothetical protein
VGSGQSRGRPSIRSQVADSGRLGRVRGGDRRRDGLAGGMETNAGGRCGLGCRRGISEAVRSLDEQAGRDATGRDWNRVGSECWVKLTIRLTGPLLLNEASFFEYRRHSSEYSLFRLVSVI